MLSELDPDRMGVILYHRFVEAFSNSDQSYSPPDTFLLYHYNGLESSCPQNKVRGRVSLLDWVKFFHHKIIIRKFYTYMKPLMSMQNMFQ